MGGGILTAEIMTTLHIDDLRVIGMIYRRDRDIRIHIYEAMNYLVKNDQHLRLRPRVGKALLSG